jgi:hypothetical protein
VVIESERWTTAEAAEFCGVTPGRFRSLAADNSVYPVAREPGLAGQNLWDAAEVRAMQESRPGQGKGGGRPRREEAS